MINKNQPLATRIRPRSIVDVVGQKHLIGEGKILTRMVNSRTLTSIILYGPPGVGKTSIANAIGGSLGVKFEYFNASFHGKKELESITKGASINNRKFIVVDEVHRLTKPNQDYLLNMIEEGSVVFIGATTENPYMSTSPALRSRSRILELQPLSYEDIEARLNYALETPLEGLGEISVNVDSDALEHIATYTNGDLRDALNTLELTVLSAEPGDNGDRHITLSDVKACLQSRQIDGDKDGDSHYNMLSAFQKSIRGSDADASLHYLARLIKVGDLLSINRRLLVIAYEDIGIANPDLVGEVLSAIESTERVGFPEARIILSYITVRLALSPKSNLTYQAIKLAERALNTKRDMEIPKSLHDSHYRGASSLGKGEGYKYSHDYPHGVVKQQFMPSSFEGDRYLTTKHAPVNKSVIETLNIYEKVNSIVKP